MIDTTWGNIGEYRAEAMAEAVRVLGGTVHEDYEAGATEPWIAHLVTSLAVASDARNILETGSFHGHTAVALARVIAALGGGNLLCCELDPERAQIVEDRLRRIPTSVVEWTVRNEDVLQVIQSLEDGSLNLAFVDDSHEAQHVAWEIDALLPKMAPNGILCFHDVYGQCDLQAVVAQYGGYSLDLPRCGPAGGLGFIQVR